jgi:hypothetical protein
MPGPAPASKIHPLCYEHHSKMTLRKLASSESGMAFACRESNCVVHYSRSEGYFLSAQNQLLIRQGPVPPHQYCSSDAFPMYLLEVQPKHPSFRLWRCPKCGMSRAVGSLT